MEDLVGAAVEVDFFVSQPGTGLGPGERARMEDIDVSAWMYSVLPSGVLISNASAWRSTIGS